MSTSAVKEIDICPICRSKRVGNLYKPFVCTKNQQFKSHSTTLNPEIAYPVEPFLFCDECGVVFREDDGSMSMKDIFAEKEQDMDLLNRSFTSHAKHRQDEIYKKRNEWIEANTEFENVLDVGCQFGFLVKEFQDRGYDAVGIDPNEPAVTIARNQLNLDLVCGYYEKESFPYESFGLISAECVAYYFRPSLRTFLDIAKRHLKVGGYLYLQIPGTEKIGTCFFPNYVRTLVSFENAEAIFNRCGYRVIAKSKETFDLGSYGIILQEAQGSQYDVYPCLNGKKVREHLSLSDYGLLTDNVGPIPTIISKIALSLHKSDPGGIMPRMFVRFVNKISRMVS